MTAWEIRKHKLRFVDDHGDSTANNRDMDALGVLCDEGWEPFAVIRGNWGDVVWLKRPRPPTAGTDPPPVALT